MGDSCHSCRIMNIGEVERAPPCNPACRRFSLRIAGLHCAAAGRRHRSEGGIRWQFGHVIDIVPALLKATGIPALNMADGIAQKPMEGVSLACRRDCQIQQV
jgi:hypothetical protein